MAEVERDIFGNSYRSIAIQDLLNDPGQVERSRDRVTTGGLYEPIRRYSNSYESEFGEFGGTILKFFYIMEEGILTAEDQNAGSLAVRYCVYDGAPLSKVREEELMNEPPLQARRKVNIRGQVIQYKNGGYYLSADKIVPIGE